MSGNPECRFRLDVPQRSGVVFYQCRKLRNESGIAKRVLLMRDCLVCRHRMGERGKNAAPR